MRIGKKLVTAIGLAMTAGAASLLIAPRAQCQPNTTVTSHPAAAVEMGVTSRVVLHGVSFEPNSAKLTADSKPLLDEAAAQLREKPQTLVFIDDQREGGATSTALALQRGEAVASYLKRRGVSVQPVAFFPSGNEWHAAEVLLANAHS